MAERKKVTVTINQRTYTVVGNESQEHVELIARLVDEKMNEIHQVNKHLDATKLAVLTALNTMNEHIKVNEQYETMNKKQQSFQKENDQLTNQLQKLTKSHEELKVQQDALRAKYETLVEEHKQLKATYNQLYEKHDTCVEKYDVLNEEHENMKNEYESLNEKYEHLKEEHEELLTLIEEE